MLDVVVIGGGIVGLATAHALQQLDPGLTVTVLEQEDRPGLHQTGHNSGVIHSGIYYAPGSLKAKLCAEGLVATKRFCAEESIAVETCGKMLVATDAAEKQRMDRLVERAAENQIRCEPIDAQELRRREPNVTGVGAVYIPATGIVDYRTICTALVRRIEAASGALITGAGVDRIEETGDRVVVHGIKRAPDGTAADLRVEARHMIACAGLQADRIVQAAGLEQDFQIVPFRGEYFRLPASRNDLIASLIYPIPDPDLPFLGIHLTRMIEGGITVGPNAVLGFARERYRKFSVNMTDVADMAKFPGFWRVIGANLKSGIGEMRNSLWKRGYLQACRKYCPSLTLDDLLPHEAGIRAQAVMRNGALVHDFMLKKTARSVHVCNAPSPAATSALPIGKMVAGALAELRH